MKPANPPYYRGFSRHLNAAEQEEHAFECRPWLGTGQRSVMAYIRAWLSRCWIKNIDA